MKKDPILFLQRFQVPPFLHDWIDRFFEPADIEIGLAFAESPEAAPPRFSESALHRACRRGILRKTDSDRYELADFHSRFEIWALFEGWKDVPENVREALNEWELEHYVAHVRPQIETLKRGEPRRPGQIYPTYLLLPEADRVIDRAESVYLWPCNCRAMVGGCKGDLYTCLRFDNPGEIGWEISKERAKAIALEANRSGLMQSGEIGLSPEGRLLGAICNCCADCCYPHRAARRLEAEKLWPETRYVARHLTDRCTACGRCVRRCPFDVFEMVKGDRPVGSKNRWIRFQPDRCRGCGLCATGCPDDAVEMVRVESDIETLLG